VILKKFQKFSKIIQFFFFNTAEERKEKKKKISKIFQLFWLKIATNFVGGKKNKKITGNLWQLFSGTTEAT
jgi:hypothetical protein